MRCRLPPPTPDRIKSSMNDELRHAVELAVTYQVPAICGFYLASPITGMPEDWLRYLEKNGHLESLGKSTEGCQRYFSTQYLLGLRHNEEWLNKAVVLVRKHFKVKNTGSNSKSHSKAGDPHE